MKEKKMSMSLDKISLVGHIDMNIDFYSYFNELLFSNLLFKEKVKKVTVSNKDFLYSYMIEGLGFLQYGNFGKIRLEFNPNKLGLYQKEVLSKILMIVYDIHFTRIDVAIDLFNYDFINYNIVDVVSRKKAYYYDRVGNIETVYLGSLKTNKFIRIYNKAKEQHVNSDWWRLELQLRDVYIDKYLNSFENFFEGIFIFKYKNLDNFNLSTRAVLNYLLQDYSRFSELGKNERSKYRKIIFSLELESLNFINEVVHFGKQEIINYLNYLTSGFIYSKK